MVLDHGAIGTGLWGHWYWIMGPLVLDHGAIMHFFCSAEGVARPALALGTTFNFKNHCFFLTHRCLSLGNSMCAATSFELSLLPSPYLPSSPYLPLPSPSLSLLPPSLLPLPNLLPSILGMTQALNTFEQVLRAYSQVGVLPWKNN